jgi:hypothetical protein
MTLDKDGNLHQTPRDSKAESRTYMPDGGWSVEKNDGKGNTERRVYDGATGRLKSREEKDKDGSVSYQFDKNGKLASSDRVNSNGSSEHSEYAENGNRTVMVRNDGKGNKETVTLDPASGKEVASDIKFKDKSTMHVVFDADGNVKEIASKDKDGNVNQWKQDSKDNSAATVNDIPRPHPFTGISAREIKFPNGFKVHLDFAPSSGYIQGIWTSDRDMKGVKDVNIASIKRK